MAESRPSEPPTVTGFPVITPGESPWILEYSSYIHAISRGPVFTSGAGMSRYGPTTMSIAAKNARDRRSSSTSDSFFGSTFTPPLPPPNGTSSRAVFHVINAAKQRNSSSEAFGWNRSPPLNGPRAALYWTRQPG